MALAKLNHNYLDPLKVSNENIDGTLGVNTLNVSSTITAPTINSSTINGTTINGTTINGNFVGSGASLINIPNGALTNSSVTINGTSVALGGSISIIALPPQSAGTTGFFLQSNGSTATWVQLGLATPSTPGTVYAYSNISTGNFGVGSNIFSNISTGSGNTVMGQYALNGLQGGNGNTAIGQSAGNQIANASYNTTIGYNSMFQFGPNGGGNNTAIGSSAGGSVTGSAYYNTFIGNEAGGGYTGFGNAFTSGTNNIIIGYQAVPSSSNPSNEITLGNSNITAFRIPGAGVNFTRTSNLIQSQAPAQIPLSIQGIASQTAYLQNWLNYTGAVVGSIDNSGNLVAAGDVTTNSDSRLKDNVEQITDALAIVEQINGVTYSLISDDKKIRHVGLIAQDVEAVMPEAVLENENGIKSVAYGNLVGLLVEAIKELRAEVTELRGIIDGL
jgi:hypothetical protein